MHAVPIMQPATALTGPGQGRSAQPMPPVTVSVPPRATPAFKATVLAAAAPAMARAPSARPSTLAGFTATSTGASTSAGAARASSREVTINLLT